MQDPVFSIITPLYNRGWCVGDCIESIGLGAAAVEMIIVDDGSKDDSVAQVQQTIERLGLQHCITVIQQQNAGPSAARNRAAAMARGAWLVFLDSDDLWLPWTLPVLLGTLENAPAEAELAFLHGQNFANISELSALVPAVPETSLYPGFVAAVGAVPKMRYGACNAAIRKQTFDRLGGFPPELRCMEDTDLFLRVGGGVMVVSRPVLAALRRSGHDSLSGNAAEVEKGFRWLFSKEKSGRYAGPPSDRRNFLAGSCAYAIRTAFAAGNLARAYRLYLGNLRLLFSPRTRKHLVRLPLTPLLHFYDPTAYPFRWRPA